MTVQANYVESLFANLENGKSGAFFEHVADDVNWTVMGSHPLAGDYHTKVNFLTHTFGRLNKILKEGVVLRVTNVLVDGDSAAWKWNRFPQRSTESLLTTGTAG
jgi:uncharacterized protein